MEPWKGLAYSLGGMLGGAFGCLIAAAMREEVHTGFIRIWNAVSIFIVLIFVFVGVRAMEEIIIPFFRELIKVLRKRMVSPTPTPEKSVVTLRPQPKE